MKRLFSFKSLGARDASDTSLQTAPLCSDKKLGCSEKACDCSLTVKDIAKDPSRYPENEDSPRVPIRRSRSFSSGTMNGDFREGNLVSLSDLCRPVASCGNSPHQASSCQVHCHRPLCSHAVHKQGSPGSSRNTEISSENSPCCSPILSRCNVSQQSRFQERNTFLDQHTDGGNQEVKAGKQTEKCLSESGIDFSEDNRAYQSAVRLQDVQSTAVSSIMYNKEDVRTYSLREANDSFHDFSKQNCIRDDSGLASSWRHTKEGNKKSSHAFPGKLSMNFQDYDSESSATVEDIYMDSFAQDLEKYDCFVKKRIMDNSSDQQDTDEELLEKLNDIEKMIELLSEEYFDLEELNKSESHVSSLFQTIRDIQEDRKYLALDLSAQIKCRLAERYAAKRHLRQAKLELKRLSRRSEREKLQLQFNLRKDLERSSSDWSMKFEMIQLEKQRLQEQVVHLTEQNVSYQREISSLKGTDGVNKSRKLNLKMELTNLTANVEKLGAENKNLEKALLEKKDRLDATEKERDCIQRCFNEKEREHKELQRLVVRFERTCNEQERTIDGLRQGYSDAFENNLTERNDQLNRLQMEQIRLTGIEQNLRKELKTCRYELETLRQENIALLNRLQAVGNGGQFSSIKLDQELRDRVDCLQTESLSLVNDFNHFNDNLLELLRYKQFEHSYPFVEYRIRSQSLRARQEYLRTSLQTIVGVLDEKSDLYAMVCQSQSSDGDMPKQSKDELEIRLKSEVILTRLLREKLHSNALEIERLEADLASSIRLHDVLQTEIQRMQDEVSSLSHKTTNMELKLMRKDEQIKQLENDHQECTKELTAARNMLLKVTEERNHMWEEVKSSKESIMHLNYEVCSLQKKIEELDEDVLTKEGQISILRDSLSKPFDITCSPRTVKEFSLE
ncbi:uncharacterized protein LOC141834367 [Curcuma longa]|uniref:uncharacterized protein LOC141834367 n=1 Tax=Curcuma longa TaxID=136217 RepID=UPI003D9DE231